MFLLFSCRGRPSTFAIARRGRLSAHPHSHNHRNRAGPCRALCTTASQRTPIPRSLPSLTPTKSRAILGRTADVVRGRVVPASRQAVNEVEERKIREAKESHLQKRLQEERLEQERQRLERERQQQTEKTRIQSTIAAKQNELKYAEQQRRNQIILKEIKEKERYERWTERQDQIWARLVQVEQAFSTIARSILHQVLGSKTSIALPLRESLDELNAKRERRWKDVLDEILEQKARGSPLHKFWECSMVVHDGLHELTVAIKELSRRQPRGSFPGLFFLGESLRFSQVDAEAHDWRGWNRVALRNKLAPEIFEFDARSLLLMSKLDAILRLAQHIKIQVGYLVWHKSSSYTFNDERTKILAELMEAKAEFARDLSRPHAISGFRPVIANRAQEMASSSHGDFLQAELCRVVAPILRLAGLPIDREIQKILDNDPNTNQRLIDPLDRFRKNISGLSRAVRDCITEVAYWRGLQKRYQSRWGQTATAKSTTRYSLATTGSPDTVAVALPSSLHVTVGRLINGPVETHQQPRVAPARSPIVSYVTTMTFAHSVLEHFRWSPVLGVDILSPSRLEQVRSTSHRSQLEFLVLANDHHIAIFHIALFEGWDPQLLHIPALKEILEDPHVLKVGVNLARHAERLKNHTTINMENTVEFNDYAKRHILTRKTVENGGEGPQSDGLSELVFRYYGSKLPTVLGQENITLSGLVRFSSIQDLASGAYATVMLYNMLQRLHSSQEPSVSQSLGPSSTSSFNILGRPLAKVAIDPYWRQNRKGMVDWGLLRELNVRSTDFNRVGRSRIVGSTGFSRVAHSRRLCLNEIVEDLTSALIKKNIPHVTLQQYRKRSIELANMGRRQDVKAMYLRIFFHERPEDILVEKGPLYSTRQILNIATRHKVEIPPDREAQFKAQLEAESKMNKPHREARERGEAWIKSVRKSERKDVLVTPTSDMRSARAELAQEYRRDILLVYAVRQATPASDAFIASIFSITAEQVRLDIQLIESRKLFQHVHKIKDDSPMFRPVFEPSMQLPSWLQHLATDEAGDEIAAPRANETIQAASPDQSPASANLHQYGAESRSERLKTSRRDLSRKRWLAEIWRRLQLREAEARRGISLASSPRGLSNDEKTAIDGECSFRDWYDLQKEWVVAAAKRKAERSGLPPPHDVDLFPAEETGDAGQESLPISAEEQALLDYSAKTHPPPARRPRSRLKGNERPSSSLGSGRRTSLVKRTESHSIPLVKPFPSLPRTRSESRASENASPSSRPPTRSQSRTPKKKSSSSSSGARTSLIRPTESSRRATSLVRRTESGKRITLEPGSDETSLVRRGVDRRGNQMGLRK